MAPDPPADSVRFPEKAKEYFDLGQDARFRMTSFVENVLSPILDAHGGRCPSTEILAEVFSVQGFLGTLVPGRQGGAGLGHVSFGRLCEAVARLDASVQTFVTTQNMVTRALSRWGFNDLHRCYLADIIAGERTAGFALTEPGAGSDVANLSATLEPDGQDYRLTGEKIWVTHGAGAGVFLTFARHGENLTAVLVDADSDRLEVTPMQSAVGLQDAGLVRVAFDRCPVPSDAVLPEAGMGLFPVALDALTVGRIGVAWCAMGLLRACGDLCVDHTRSRRTFGRLLADHQLVRRMETNLLVSLNTVELLCLRASSSADATVPDAPVEAMMAKYHASTAAFAAADDVLQLHGAAGIEPTHPVQRIWRDARMLTIIEGSSEVLQNEISRNAPSLLR